MTDRRPLGTGPDRANTSRTQNTALPRVQLAAERLPAARATTEPKPPRPHTGRRILGAGPDAQAVTPFWRGRRERVSPVGGSGRKARNGS
ncbi:hypothetical protein AB0A94_34445 [Streptomyces sp. NPDC044984]|uniref:hypothetical protein n=1 Tax=Streptomyces sp. NPDC044984 TaxID=3154335 RepID=UPI0033F34530